MARIFSAVSGAIAVILAPGVLEPFRTDADIKPCGCIAKAGEAAQSNGHFQRMYRHAGGPCSIFVRKSTVSSTMPPRLRM
jgi:hypothetical protein